MEKNIIRLTEQDLHNLIKESVEQVLLENSEQELDEGFGDFIRSFVGQYGKRGANQIQQGYNNAKNKMQQGYNAAKQGMQNVGNQIQQGYNNVKSDIQQTARNAKQDSSMKDMQKAFDAFKMAVEKYSFLHIGLWRKSCCASSKKTTFPHKFPLRLLLLP